MKTELIYLKISRCVSSCKNYDHIKSCLNFLTFKHFDEELKYRISALIQEKVYDLRRGDIEEHITQLKIIGNQFKN